jgi:hypothetical protein
MRALAIAIAVTGCVPAESTEEAAAAAAVPVPTIAAALAACGNPGQVAGLPGGTDLQRVNVDLTAFPDALCNDGSGAAFFFRPSATVNGQSRWVIELMGGGGCKSPDDCANRWCSVGTNFGMQQMSSTLLPAAGTVGRGILYRGPGASNPLADANHVLLKYCSSDNHSGHSGPLVVNAVHPTNGLPVQFQFRFEGQAIFDALIATLRRDGAAPPDYTIAGGPAVALPDLDDATEVVFAGASAGGGGVINHADRLGELLRATNTACVGAPTCPLQYRALTDSTFGPNREPLNWNTSTYCIQNGLCSWQDVLTAGTSMYVSHGDESCETWHAANAPATAWLCNDTDHVIRHHITTPMFVRMGLRDQLLSSNLIATGVTVPGQGPMTLNLFAQLVRNQLLGLANLPVLAEEGAAITTVPGVYGPPCAWHDTLESNLQVFNTQVLSGGSFYSMFEVADNWVLGGAPTSVVYVPGDPATCP